MMTKRRFVTSLVITMAVAMGAHVFAEGSRPPVTHLSGTFDDYVWVEVGAGAGAWHVTGQWTARVNGNGKAEFTGSLLGVRSDLWVLQTGADPANPALRMPHTHHVGLLEADVTVIPNGIRLEGIATITANGSVAPYSGSMIRVEITGGNLLRYSNINLTFLGAAVDHFGPQRYDGLVVIGRRAWGPRG